jgi:hypothetical protein
MIRATEPISTPPASDLPRLRFPALVFAPCRSRHPGLNGPDAIAKLASLQGTDTWKQDEFIEKGGSATLPGTENPVTGAAAICARQFMDAKLPVKAASAPG